MKLKEFKIINQTMLLNGTPFENNTENFVHPSQENKRRIKLVILFWIGPIREDESEENIDPDSKEMRLASCHVPKGCPVSKVRELINYMETSLFSIYKTCRRANLTMVADEDSNDYEPTFDLPLYGVYFV